MSTIFSVETSNGVELKRGFRKLTTARKWAAYGNKDPYFSNEKAVVCAISNGDKKYLGVVIRPGIFITECTWVPYNNPKNIRFTVKKDGSIVRRK